MEFILGIVLTVLGFWIGKRGIKSSNENFILYGGIGGLVILSVGVVLIAASVAIYV
jgi:hypothetical protein